ncbi:MAG: hypothetical protein ACRDKT_16870 [Actinomycetota bacterium]
MGILMGTMFRRGGMLVLVTTIAIIAVATPAAAQPRNLVENPGFEETRLPDEVMELQKELGLNQPVLPVGWIFEGASELFDHTHSTFYTGEYSAAISGSWSGPRRECSVQCVEIPGGDQKDSVYGSVYSVSPAWRTDAPIAVEAGKRYKLSFAVKGSIWMDGSGAVSWVRWLDANGVPIGHTPGPSKIADCGGANYVTFAAGNGTFADGCHSPDWSMLKSKVTAPDGASFATVVLSYSDSAWIGQVIFDDVFFG